MNVWLFCLYALFGVLFVIQAVSRGKRSVLNHTVRLGPLEHPLRWFVAALSWWHRLCALLLLAFVIYGCVVDATIRLIVAITIGIMMIVTFLWKRRQRRDPGAAA